MARRKSIRRSMLWNGFKLAAELPGALLYTFALNLGVAFVFSLRLHAQLASILDHSLAAERLNSAFDLGTLLGVTHRLGYMAPSTGSTAYLGLPLYLFGYFILVPGTLFCFRTQAPPRLSILVSSGISCFWRFVRITLLTAIVSAIVLGPLIALQSSWSAQVDENTVGVPAVLRELAGVAIIALVAAFLRLYFDLVEVYTVQLGDQYRKNGMQDRRVRRVLLPAMRTLWHNLPRAYFSFLFLTLLGIAAVAATGYGATHMLAQPRVWPTFLLVQAGLLGMLATRVWQRAAETILANDYPLLAPSEPVVEMAAETNPAEELPGHFPGDAQSDPEPCVPSLEEPDPAVFHHEPGPPLQPPPAPLPSPNPQPNPAPQANPEPKRQVPWWME